MAPAALRFGERPTAARVVRRRLLSRLDDGLLGRATWARVAIARDPLNLQGGRLRPPLALVGTR